MFRGFDFFSAAAAGTAVRRRLGANRAASRRGTRRRVRKRGFANTPTRCAPTPARAGHARQLRSLSRGAHFGGSAPHARAFDPTTCQFLAGLALAEGRLAEMATGEGKTLVALLPAFCFALQGRGVHVATVNSYLAERDCEFARDRLRAARAERWPAPKNAAKPQRNARPTHADVTYGVGTEFGFDYLRDQLAIRARPVREGAALFHEILLGQVAPAPELVQRGHAFAIIDEADSVLIDEARSPLIIATGAKAAKCHAPGLPARRPGRGAGSRAEVDFTRDRALPPARAHAAPASSARTICSPTKCSRTCAATGRTTSSPRSARVGNSAAMCTTSCARARS